MKVTISPELRKQIIDNHHNDNERHGKDCPVCFPKKQARRQA